MAPKKRGAALSTARKKRRPAPDWRYPLFYWRGTLTDGQYSSEDPVCITATDCWSGTWVASEKDLPDAAAFKESLNTFKLQFGPCEVMRKVGSADRDATVLIGTYKLDQGDGEGLRDYSDIEQILHIIETASLGEDGADGGGSSAIVGARGTTEFGQFASLGLLLHNSETRTTELTLVRRYLSDDDSRTKLCAREIAALAFGDVEKKTLAKEVYAAAPWEALPWKADE